jgi:hypothetical protein
MKCSVPSVRRVLVSLLAFAAVSSSAQQGTPARAATPVEPIAAIIDAFRSHSIVTISDPHGNAQLMAFNLALIRDPRFPAVVNDIVQEGGNARYQELMDRYVRGENVPYAALSQVWDNSTQPDEGGFGTRGGYVPELYRMVREVNRSLPRERQLRVLLGDPPIDWDKVQTREDHRKWIEMRDTYPAALVQLEVLARERRALVIFGQLHAQRKQLAANYDMDSWQAQTLVSVLERTTPTKVFSVWWATDLPKLQPDVVSWRAPSLATVRGTVLGAVDFAEYASLPARASFRDGKIVPVGREEWRSLRMEDQFDAVLYLGPLSETRPATPPSQDICADRAYLEKRLRHLDVAASPGQADRLRQSCAGVAPK